MMLIVLKVFLCAVVYVFVGGVTAKFSYIVFLRNNKENEARGLAGLAGFFWPAAWVVYVFAGIIYFIDFVCKAVGMFAFAEPKSVREERLKKEGAKAAEEDRKNTLILLAQEAPELIREEDLKEVSLMLQGMASAALYRDQEAEYKRLIGVRNAINKRTTW